MINNPVVATQTGANAFTANLNPQYFKQWRYQLNRMRNGSENAKILCIGDSTTAGVQGTSPLNSHSWPTQFAKMLNRNYFTAATGGFMASTGGFTTQWTSTGTWLQGPFGPCGSSFQGLPSNGPLIATPGFLWDTVDIYYMSNGNIGNFTAQATGGTLTTVTAQTSAGEHKVTITAGSPSASNTLTINALNSSNASYIIYVEPYLSTQSQIIVGNMGSPGSTSGSWLDQSIPDPTFGFLNLLPLYQPNLTFISLGINDANQSLSVASYKANMLTLIAAVQAVGSDVVLVTMPPSNAYLSNEVQIVAAQYAISSSLNIPIIDFFNRLGATYQSTIMADTYHPNDWGYLDWAQTIYAAITAI